MLNPKYNPKDKIGGVDYMTPVFIVGRFPQEAHHLISGQVRAKLPAQGQNARYIGNGPAQSPYPRVLIGADSGLIFLGLGPERTGSIDIRFRLGAALTGRVLGRADRAHRNVIRSGGVIIAAADYPMIRCAVQDKNAIRLGEATDLFPHVTIDKQRIRRCGGN